MWLFDFLKKNKKGRTLDFKNEKDLGKVINRGIYFEDTDQFLKWGTPIKELAKQLPVKEKLFADRVVYNWGEHTILSGLKLEFTTIFWNHKDESRYKKFNAIEFWAIGNDIAEESLKLISDHIEKHFGEPARKEVSEKAIELEWFVNDVKLYLYFFEQYANKLHFEISLK
jgi:hypothetical protein